MGMEEDEVDGTTIRSAILDHLRGLVSLLILLCLPLLLLLSRGMAWRGIMLMLVMVLQRLTEKMGEKVEVMVGSS